MLAGYAAHVEHRIVGEDGTNADDHGVHARPQPVQMVGGGRLVDPLAFAAPSRNPSVEGLAKLGNDERPVGRRLENRGTGIASPAGRIGRACTGMRSAASLGDSRHAVRPIARSLTSGPK